MNAFDDLAIDPASFSMRDLQGQDAWVAFVPVFGSLTVIGATTYSGRMRIVGAQVFVQVKFSAATSIASTAGTDYLNSPVAMNGLAGHAVMSNDSSNIAVGNCHVDVATSRIYLPSQSASANVFNLAGWFEI